ncbi:protein indeterminate-domain 5, chloroplastic-like [Aristolochia californica]|uniref:protein indeterminate-domain 5, chloroplastic-like n=1 Tax=Aristolochia californica TaxID=171875 RepID=UPI0035DDE888
MAAASSSTPFFGIREEDQQIKQQQPQQQQQSSASTPTSSATPATAQPQKKKRNLPGTPNPDAEVIALSPKTLMATNRFICEVCNKGFQREQNLQLHRRGHNLPWKLRQKSTKEVRRRVYLCPEPTCVHHDPSRALGDLTGIKKHFCRKHGEKKWKCDKCSKRYAVQSDWKAHSKTCGTREYRCDCGTLFSRRDSFITHRAFCDALAQESARLPTGLTTMGSQLYGSSSMGLGLSQVGSQMASLQDQSHPSSDLLRLGGASGSQFDHLIPGPNPSPFRPPPNPSSAFYLPTSNHDFHEEQSHHGLMQSKPFHGLMQLPDLQNNTNTSAAAAANIFNLSFFSNSSSTRSINSSNNAAGNNSNNHLSSSGLIIPEQFSNANGGGEGSSLFTGNIMGDHMGPGVSSLYSASVQNESVLPQMSATALLQKAAQMGATTSSNSASMLRGFGGGGGSSSSGTKPDRPHLSSSNFRGSFGGGGGGDTMRSQMENETHLQDLMNSLANGGSNIFGGSSGGMSTFGGNCSSGGHEQDAAFGTFNAGRISVEQQHQNLCNMDETKLHQNLTVSIGGSDRLTRDFLGVGGMVRSIGGGISQREQHHGLDIGSLDSEMKSASGGSRSFGGSLQ